MAAGPRNLNVSNLGAYLTLNFDKAFEKSKILESLRKLAALFEKLDGFFVGQDEFYEGVVLTASYTLSQVELTAVIKLIAKMLLITGSNAPEVFTCNASSDRHGIRSLVEIASVLNFEQEIKPGMSQFTLDVDFTAPYSVGFQVKLDLSTKPAISTGNHKTYESLIAGFTEAAELSGLGSISFLTGSLFQ